MNTWDSDIKRAARIKEQIKALEDEYNDLLNKYEFDHAENIPAGDYIVQVSPTLRFDAATAKKNLTPEEYAATLATKPDSTTAKKILSPERYAAAQKHYGWTKKIVPVTDVEV